MIRLLTYLETLEQIEGRTMRARIADGYTRTVSVGDNQTIPEVEFTYRPVRGSDIQDHVYDLARSDNPSECQRKAVAGRVEDWVAEGFDPGPPTFSDLAELDGYAFRDMYNVIFNGQAPAQVMDREVAQTQDKQAEDDAKNLQTE